jgi:hypothetical protein
MIQIKHRRGSISDLNLCGLPISRGAKINAPIPFHPLQAMTTPHSFQTAPPVLRAWALLCSFVILHSAFDIQAAPPPELTVLRQQYEKVFAERVTAVHDANLAALDAKFTTALDNAIATAKSAGDLPTVLAIQADKKLLAEKQPLPADDDQTPEPLKKLRAIYRDQLAKLTEQKTANATALLTPYAAKLQALEATLTKNDRVEEAKEVMDYRAALAVDAPAPAAITVAPNAPTMPPPLAAADLPKGDDGKAAEWVLSIGGTVKVGDEDIKSAEALPRGKFYLTSIIMPTTMPDTPDAAFDQLAGLGELKVFQISGGNQTDAAFRFLSSCPKLVRIDVQNCLNFQGSWLHYLAPLQNLQSLWVTSSAKSDLSGLARLPGGKLEILDLRATAINADTFREIGRFKQLNRLGLRETNIGDECLPVLATLNRLDSLSVMQTAITNKGLISLAKLPIKTLGFGNRLDDFSTDLAQIAAAFPKLEALDIPPGTLTSNTLSTLAAAWPALKTLNISNPTSLEANVFTDIAQRWPQLQGLVLSKTNTSDAHLLDLAKLKKLERLRIAGCTEITPAGLTVLQKMGGLKMLGIKPGQLPEADLNAFKKQRPDVQLQTW